MYEPRFACSFTFACLALRTDYRYYFSRRFAFKIARRSIWHVQRDIRTVNMWFLAETLRFQVQDAISRREVEIFHETKITKAISRFDDKIDTKRNAWRINNNRETMNILYENLNKEPTDGTDQTVSELFSSKLLCENTKCLAQDIGLSLYLLQRERDSEQLLGTPQRLINESARGEKGERGLDLPLSLFKMKSFCIPLSSSLFGKLVKRPAFYCSRSNLRGADTFSRSLADLALMGQAPDVD